MNTSEKMDLNKMWWIGIIGSILLGISCFFEYVHIRIPVYPEWTGIYKTETYGISLLEFKTRVASDSDWNDLKSIISDLDFLKDAAVLLIFTAIVCLFLAIFRVGLGMIIGGIIGFIIQFKAVGIFNKMNKAIDSDGEGYSFFGMSIGYYLLYVAVALLIAGGIIVLVAKARDDDSSREEDSNNEIRNDYIEKTNGDWTCPVCGERYSKYAKQCVCGYIPGDYYDPPKTIDSNDEFWKCPRCGKLHSYYFKKCSCGYAYGDVIESNNASDEQIGNTTVNNSVDDAEHLDDGFWKCPRCGKLYSQYAKKCSCGYIYSYSDVESDKVDHTSAESVISEDVLEINPYTEDGAFEEMKLTDVLEQIDIDAPNTMGEPVEKIVNEIPEQDNVRRVFEDNNIDDIPSEQSTAVDITAPVLNNRSELESIEMIKKYKELLDLGILNQDEFDKKKRELLNL